ncbi:unnamed protein product [Prorocentrum cordatum]|uniref:Protein kinase domain-containing protein n=1 Tax=Prorocentrum cordatum TaxID=2364126 RepID=A0ABN9T554_9DINO|nr:unnamed protein product [Polarella glacialis]
MLTNVKEVVGQLASWSGVQDSKHVVSLLSAMVEEQRVFMVMEGCESNILRKISGSPSFWAPESHRVLKEMLLGVQACNLAVTVRRSIKPHDCPIRSDGSTVKLCDFGLVVRTPRGGQLREVASTILFTSQEMLMGYGYGKAKDVWPFRVIAYWLCFDVLPFPKAFCQSTRVHEEGYPAMGPPRGAWGAAAGRRSSCRTWSAASPPAAPRSRPRRSGHPAAGGPRQRPRQRQRPGPR